MSRPGNAWRKIHGKITKRPTNFSWMIKERLAGSGMPTTPDEIDWIASRGVKSIVTMTEEPLPESWLKGMGYLHVPTEDLTAPEIEGIEAAVEFIRRENRDGRAVMVHCAAGLGRAGTILACYLIKYEGHSAADAILRVRRERPGSIQSDRQETAIRMYEKIVSGNFRG